MDRLLSLDRLVVFYLVATYMSFTRAARELCVTQPAVTKRIEALEKDCGERLFERRPGKLSLTDAGAALLPEAEALYGSAVKATRLVRDLSEPSSLLRLSLPAVLVIRTHAHLDPLPARSVPRCKSSSSEATTKTCCGASMTVALKPRWCPWASTIPGSIPSSCPSSPNRWWSSFRRQHPLAKATDLLLADLGDSPLVLRAHMPLDTSSTIGRRRKG